MPVERTQPGITIRGRLVSAQFSRRSGLKLPEESPAARSHQLVNSALPHLIHHAARTRFLRAGEYRLKYIEIARINTPTKARMLRT